jgi:hypothetical protein
MRMTKLLRKIHRNVNKKLEYKIFLYMFEAKFISEQNN